MNMKNVQVEKENKITCLKGQFFFILLPMTIKHNYAFKNLIKI